MRTGARLCPAQRGISRSGNLVVDAGEFSMTFDQANVLRLVRCGHSRAPFQSCAVSVRLGKAVKEMLRLMKKCRG